MRMYSKEELGIIFGVNEHLEKILEDYKNETREVKDIPYHEKCIYALAQILNNKYELSYKGRAAIALFNGEHTRIKFNLIIVSGIITKRILALIASNTNYANILFLFKSTATERKPNQSDLEYEVINMANTFIDMTYGLIRHTQEFLGINSPNEILSGKSSIFDDNEIRVEDLIKKIVECVDLYIFRDAVECSKYIQFMEIY